MDASGDIVQLKVRLLGISPMVWRRVLVPSSITLRQLHGVLQVVMGWEGIHLYAFDIYAVQYGSFELAMADHWAHEVRIEQVSAAVPKQTYLVCIGGSGAARLKIAAGRRDILSVGMMQTGMMHGGIWA